MIEITRQDQEFNVLATSLIFDGTYSRIAKAPTHTDAHRTANSLQDYFEAKGEEVTVKCAECIDTQEVTLTDSHPFTCTLCNNNSVCRMPGCTGECVKLISNWCVRCVVERIRQLGFNL